MGCGGRGAMPIVVGILTTPEPLLTFNARKYHESLHFLFEWHWYELTSADCPDRMEPGLN